jgi:TetR/AcrR family transcriptional regulator, fatty acid metabolism regulator protein
MAGKKTRRPDGSPQAWQRRAAERPAEILRAARALLEEHGYAAVSMARIAKQAGVSEATLYKYFEHKQDLMGQVLREWATPFIEGLQQELPLVTGLRARITLIATRYLRGMSQTPRLHRVYYQELRWDDAYIGSPMHKLNQRFAGFAVKVIEEAIANGEVAPDTNPVVVRDLLFGGLEHIGQRTTFAGRTLDVDAEAQAFARHLLDGILVKRAPVPAVAAPVPDVNALNALVGRLQQAVDDLENLRSVD